MGGNWSIHWHTQSPKSLIWKALWRRVNYNLSKEIIYTMKCHTNKELLLWLLLPLIMTLACLLWQLWVKRCHSVSLMGHKPWYWQNSYMGTFWCSLISCSYPHPFHTCYFCLFVPFDFKQASDLEGVWILGSYCHLSAWPLPVSLGKLTKQRSLQKQRPWYGSMRTKIGVFPSGVMWQILLSTKHQALTN